MNYLELISVIGNSKLDYIHREGHAKPGCNGPYKNQDTPVRNTSHWLITYAYLYEKTGEQKYYSAVQRLATYLIDKKNYGVAGSVRHRTDYRFDNTNGVIGQAWTIEALVVASVILKDTQYYRVAKQIFECHKFNYTYNFWEITDFDGTRDFDRTFNHQLWFAASGAQLLNYERENSLPLSEEINRQIILFLSESEERYFSVHKNGLIVHVMDCILSEEEQEYKYSLEKKRKIKSLIHNPIAVVKKKLTDKRAAYLFSEGLEEGYHLFDMYGFAILYQWYSWHPIYKSEAFLKAVDYIFSSDAMVDLMNPCGGFAFNRFAFSYNSPAFEYPFVCLIFGNKKCMKLQEKLFDFQIDKTYDEGKCSLCKNCNDSETLDARLYELVNYLRSNDGLRTRREEK